MTINATTSQPVTPDEPVTRAQMLRIVTDAVEAGLPAPMGIDLFLHDTDNRHLHLRMDDNRADEVDAWVRAVSPDGETSAASGSLFHTTRRPWREYGTRRDAVWHGWQISVWSAIDEPQDGTR